MAKRAESGLLENIKTIVYAGLIAIGIRTVGFEPFNIPSGSMIPTLLVGDYLFVSKYSYGYSRYSLPFSPPLFSGRVFGRVPHRGDVAVFKWPRDNKTDYIKRIIGLPGDRVQMLGGQLHINGQLVPRQKADQITTRDELGIRMQGQRYVETLPDGVKPGGVKPGGVKHDIQKLTDDSAANNTVEFKIPAGHVFAMGDNRDNSSDSRFPIESGGVGMVPLENLVGRAEFIFFSVDAEYQWWEFWMWPYEIRWSRIFSGIH